MTLGVWRRRAVVAVLATVSAVPHGVAVAAGPPRAKDVTLTTGLRLEWSGVTGVRLRIPDAARLPRYGARLTLRGGTYAGVRMGRVGTCDGGKPCSGVTMHLDYTHTLATRIFRGNPDGQRHEAYVTNDGVIPAGVWDLYLFTDGHATVVFDDTGLPRRARAYTPAGRVRGSFRFLPEFCGTAHCTPGAGYAGRLRTGGATGDTGRFGQAHGFVFHYRPDDDATPQSLHVRGCSYRQGPGDTGKAAQDHPLGCDDEVGQGTADAWATNFVASGLPPYYSAVGRGMGQDNASGRVYLGFQAATPHDLVDTEVEAWGVWYEYGVH